MLRTSAWTDQRVEIIIGNLLRAGVTIAAAIVFLGGVIFLAKYGHSSATYGVFRGEPSDLREWRGILDAALGLRGRGFIQFGLIVLIATPVARVAFSAVSFAL